VTSVLRIDDRSPFHKLIGVGGVGSGIFFALEGDLTLGRNESRAAALLDSRDYCKLHIIMHYVARLLGTGARGSRFRALPVARVGDDEAGKMVLREMSEAGIDTRYVTTMAGKPTLFSVCFQYPDGSGGNLTTSNSAAAELSADDLRMIVPELAGTAQSTIALATPEVSLEVRRAFLEMASRGRVFRAASFVSAEVLAGMQLGMFRMLDLVSLNQEEAERLTGVEFDPGRSGAFVEVAVQWLSRNYPELRLIVSAGSHGAYAFYRDRWNHCPAVAVDVMSTAGAGDALLAGILVGLAAGLPLLRLETNAPDSRVATWQTALDLGVLLASFKVQSQHTIHPEACLDTLMEFGARRGRHVHSSVEQLVST